MAAKDIKAKKRCCRSAPRCKRCPVVCRRLEADGYAKRRGRRRWKLAAKVPKKVLRAARA